jgi:hypothetical protein
MKKKKEKKKKYTDTATAVHKTSCGGSASRRRRDQKALFCGMHELVLAHGTNSKSYSRDFLKLLVTLVSFHKKTCKITSLKGFFFSFSDRFEFFFFFIRSFEVISE